METAIVKAACAIAAGLCTGIGAIGPAIGEGNAVGKALDSGLRHYRIHRYLLAGHLFAAAVRVLILTDVKGGTAHDRL